MTVELVGSTTCTIPLKCDEGTARSVVDESSLTFSCTQTAGRIVFDRLATINRLSGDYESIFAPQGKNGLVHYGTCSRAKPQF